MKLKLLIDADYIVYKATAAAETEIDFGDDVIVVTSRFTDALNATNKEISKLRQRFLWDAPDIILFFSDSINFRKKIQEDYKGHRNRKKPCGYKRVIKELKNRYEVIIMPTLEADDSMGIYATKNPGNIICSPDKDMRQIPGKLYNMDEITLIEDSDGAKWHLIQSIAGDNTDGYSGVPGLGVKRATALFEEHGYSWKTVLKAFKDKGLDEETALLNARLARILTVDDYDFEQKEPKLWSPAANYRIDTGTGFETKVDT